MDPVWHLLRHALRLILRLCQVLDRALVKVSYCVHLIWIPVHFRKTCVQLYQRAHSGSWNAVRHNVSIPWLKLVQSLPQLQIVKFKVWKAKVSSAESHRHVYQVIHNAQAFRLALMTDLWNVLQIRAVESLSFSALTLIRMTILLLERWATWQCAMKTIRWSAKMETVPETCKAVQATV